MKTMTEVLDRESKAIENLQALQTQGRHFSPEYQVASKEYRSARRARQKMVRETKQELESLQRQLRG